MKALQLNTHNEGGSYEYKDTVDVCSSASRIGICGDTLPEAQACGIPVVAYRVGGISEAVHLDVGSVLCPPHEQAAVGMAILSILVAGRNATHSAEDGKSQVESKNIKYSARAILRMYSSRKNPDYTRNMIL